MDLFKTGIFESSKKADANDIKAAQGEWIWVEGYKGFNHNLTCRDMQYEIGKTYQYEDVPILCQQGYHFCRDLPDVLHYYNNFTDEDNRTRICKVRGLVKKCDFEDYGISFFGSKIDKLVTKEITIVSELSLEEIASAVYPQFSTDFAVSALKYGVKQAGIMALGYKRKTALWIIHRGLEELAEILAENRNHYTEKEILNILIEEDIANKNHNTERN